MFYYILILILLSFKIYKIKSTKNIVPTIEPNEIKIISKSESLIMCSLVNCSTLHNSETGIISKSKSSFYFKSILYPSDNTKDVSMF